MTKLSETKNRGRRQRRIAARRAQILQAAEIVFSQKGYERATTREIANAADISEGTLYNYFASKSAILDGVAQSFADDIVQEIAELEADNLPDMMAELLTARMRSGRERRLLMLFLYEARLNPGIHRSFIQQALQKIIKETEERFAVLIESGVMRAVDPAVAARAISATVMGFAALHELGQTSQNGYSAEKWGAELTDLFMKGLAGTGNGNGEDGRAL